MELAGLLFGIAAMLGWGVADFLARLTVDRIGTYRSVVVTQLGGIFLLLFLAGAPASFESWFIPLFLVLGVMWALSILAFYKGMEVGKLSIVSPLASSWAMVAVVLSIVFFGESLSLPQIGAIAIVFAGIVLCSVNPKELAHARPGSLVKGAKYGIATMVLWGIVLTAVKITFPALGEITPIILIKIVAVAALLGYAPLKRVKWDIKWGSVWKLLLGVAVLDAAAFAAYSYGIAGGQVSLVAPVSSAFPALTLLLARVFLKERLEGSQLLGVFGIIAGLVLLALV